MIQYPRRRTLAPLLSGNGEVLPTRAGWLLKIPKGRAGCYRLAQLCDYRWLRRAEFPWRPPLRLSLRARISGTVRTGTWGFGLWNDPFGIALNPLASRLLLPTWPQAAWFFWSSPVSYLSLRDDLPANGMLAQTFRSRAGWPWLAAVGVALVFRRAAARALLRRRIREDSTRLQVDAQAWHNYEIRWDAESARFAVDGAQVLSSAVAPTPPLGAVIWIDNQFATLDPSGRLAWGVESSDSETSLEIADLRLDAGES